ncbi:HdeD family acid-resistance protein [Sphingobacterium sp. SG20118]|uniref:HdeD family acid-resistance protein n=1 Tax=Sphingobacterium sp. SG20118 TaxID=3367156 RepID=UPI0037DFC89A
MENPILEKIKSSVKHWYIPLILGILFILVGIWVSRTPLAAYLTLAIIFATTFLVAGILEIIYAIVNRNTLNHWVWELISGIIGLFLGFLLISNPAISMVALSLYVGFGILFYSIKGIGKALELKKHGFKGWIYTMIIGVAGLILSFIMIWNPVFGGMTIVFYTSFSFIILGVLNIFLSIKMKGLNKRLGEF